MITNTARIPSSFKRGWKKYQKNEQKQKNWCLLCVVSAITRRSHVHECVWIVSIKSVLFSYLGNAKKKTLCFFLIFYCARKIWEEERVTFIYYNFLNFIPVRDIFIVFFSFLKEKKTRRGKQNIFLCLGCKNMKHTLNMGGKKGRRERKGDFVFFPFKSGQIETDNRK